MEQKGIIYIIKNKLNGKSYIGQTINYKRRKRQHFNRIETCSALKRAFKKYGKEAFEMFPILELKATTKENLHILLNSFEKSYIKKYDTYNNGYNTTKGGEGTVGVPKPSEVRKRIGEKNKIHKINKRAIIQYDIDGNFIKEYSSVTEASREFENPTSARTCIDSVLSVEGRVAYNCMWKYKESENYPKTIAPHSNSKRIKVYHYSKNGELLGSYRTITEASTKTNIPKSTIKASLRERKRNIRKIIKDYWSHNISN